MKVDMCRIKVKSRKEYYKIGIKVLRASIKISDHSDHNMRVRHKQQKYKIIGFAKRSINYRQFLHPYDQDPK